MQVLSLMRMGANRARNRFPFPMVLWMDDAVLLKLGHIAPDFENWAGLPSRFGPSDDDLRDMLARNADALFGEILKLDACLLYAEYPLPARKSEFLSFLSADFRDRIRPGVRFHALVNKGAESQEELYFDKFEFD